MRTRILAFLAAAVCGIFLAACAGSAPGPVNIQGTVDEALKATQQAQTARQATVDAAVAATRAAETGIRLPATLPPANTPSPFEATVQAAVAATRAAETGARTAPAPAVTPGAEKSPAAGAESAPKTSGLLVAYPDKSVFRVAYSQDGSFMGVSVEEPVDPYTATYQLIETRSGQVITDLTGVPYFSPAPGAQRVAFFAPEGIVIYDPDTRQQVRLIPHNASSPRLPRGFSPDGRRLAFKVGSAWVGVIDVETGRELWQESALEFTKRADFSPDGKMLVVVSYMGQAVFLDAANGKPALETFTSGVTSSAPLDEGSLRQASFSPDGRWFVLSVGRSEENKEKPAWLEVFELPAGKLAKRLEGHQGPINAIAFDPAGRWLISAGEDDTVRFWEPGAWREARRLTAGQRGITQAALSPDGRLLATGGADGSIVIWEAAAGHELRRLTGHQAGVSTLAFRPDGRQLASGGEDGAVWVWELNWIRSKAKQRPKLTEVLLSPIISTRGA